MVEVHENIYILKAFVTVKAFQRKCLRSQAQNLKRSPSNKSKEFVNKHYDEFEFLKKMKI